jgi:hypothetical protein
MKKRGVLNMSPSYFVFDAVLSLNSSVIKLVKTKNMSSSPLNCWTPYSLWLCPYHERSIFKCVGTLQAVLSDREEEKRQKSHHNRAAHIRYLCRKITAIDVKFNLVLKK